MYLSALWIWKGCARKPKKRYQNPRARTIVLSITDITNKKLPR